MLSKQTRDLRAWRNLLRLKNHCSEGGKEGGRKDVAAGVARSTFLVNYDATDAREGEAKRRFCTSFSTLCFSFSEIVERNQGAISILASMICIQLVQFQGGIPADVI